ncbi:MAG: hypothetical protein ACI9D0_000994 [Bacteroidia bacterium]|jgi:hypothetical protein
MKMLLSSCIALALSATASADTFIVDSIPGPFTDFEHVQEAVDSPLVSSGDVLLVRPGIYPRFSTNKGLTIRGIGPTPDSVRFTLDLPDGSPAQLSYVSFDQCIENAVLSNVQFTDWIRVARCQGTVRLLDLEAPEYGIEDCGDVRVENSEGTMPSEAGVWVSNQSIVEFLGCDFGRSLRVSSQSRVRVANTQIRGVQGADVQFAFQCCGEDGEPGVKVSGGSLVHLVGTLGDAIQGGRGGWGYDIPSDGSGGAAIEATPGSRVRSSGYELIGGFDPEHTQQAPAFQGLASDFTIPAIDDPLLIRTGSFATGQLSTFTVHGPADSFYYLFAGIANVTIPLPNVVGFLKTTPMIPLVIANLDGIGQADYNFVMPAGLPLGFQVTVQSGLVYSADNSTRLTNPATVFVE